LIWFGIDVGKRPVIVAEAGINHNGDVSLAKELIAAAAESGADAVKFQTFIPEYLFDPYTLDNNKVAWKDEEITLRELFEKVALSDDEFVELKEYAEKLGVEIFSTPFSLTDLDRIDKLGFSVYKVASPDVVFLPLLEEMAQRGKPTILSVGTATLEEVDRAVKIFRKRNTPLALLYCVSIYPPNPEEVNLNSMKVLMEIYPDIDVGFSDHTIGVHVPIAAITMGAKIIEKHFTLDRSLPGPDQAVSMTPGELKIIRKAADEVWKSQGSKGWRISPEREQEISSFARRGAMLIKDKKTGEVIEREDVIFVRPAKGISPDKFEFIVGRVLKNYKKKYERLDWGDLV